MRGLKICLWIAGILCLLSAVGLFLPFSACESVAQFFGLENLPDSPLIMYAIRTVAATYIGIGLYFIFLAMQPLKYGRLVPFSGAVMVLIGAACMISGVMTQMPLVWYLSDSLSCAVLGILILVFWQRAKQPSE